MPSVTRSDTHSLGITIGAESSKPEPDTLLSFWNFLPAVHSLLQAGAKTLTDHFVSALPPCSRVVYWGAGYESTETEIGRLFSSIGFHPIVQNAVLCLLTPLSVTLRDTPWLGCLQPLCAQTESPLEWVETYLVHRPQAYWCWQQLLAKKESQSELMLINSNWVRPSAHI
jgi:hypothetical protein